MNERLPADPFVAEGDAFGTLLAEGIALAVSLDEIAAENGAKVLYPAIAAMESDDLRAVVVATVIDRALAARPWHRRLRSRLRCRWRQRRER